MSTFATITTGTKYLSRDIVNELVLAYSERRQCVGDSAVGGVPVGFNLQSLDFWRGMQDWVETNCVKWVDNANFSTATAYDDPADIAYTLATFRTAAGLNANGFRRATAWPGSFSYGKIQSGDIIGPWIIEDLQAAFDALRWTYAYLFQTLFWLPGPISGALDNDSGYSGTGSNQDTTQDAYDAAVLDYAISGGGSTAYTSYYSVTEDSVLAGKYDAALTRTSADVVYTSIPNHVAHTADAFYWFDGTAASGETFTDLDSLGITAKKFYITDTFTSATTNTRTQSAVASLSTPPPYNGEARLSIDTNFGSYGIITKWTFSHTL